VETEAYDGEADLACHACRGKTARNRIMYEPGGVWYVYLVYGFHYMLNIVTGEKDYPAAVLIRGIEGAIGPGRTTKALNADLRFNGKSADKKTGLWIEEPGAGAEKKAESGTAGKEEIRKQKIRRAPRIGVAYAGVWAKKPYRFILE
jgi:DNA-3-methyladenine glycosylase